MPNRPRARDPFTGDINLIGDNAKRLRTEAGYSLDVLAARFQSLGYDLDRDCINRIENKSRFASDIEIMAYCTVFQTTFEELTTKN